MTNVKLHQSTLLGTHIPYIGGKMYKQSVNCITVLMMKHPYMNLTARELEDKRVVVWRIFLVDWLVGLLGGGVVFLVVVAATIVVQ
jgi:hypothetical protein